jgi:hypothetical protein
MVGASTQFLGRDFYRLAKLVFLELSSTSYKDKVCSPHASDYFSHSLTSLLAETQWPHCFPISPQISGYTGSDEAISRARSWLSGCLSKHKTTCSIDQPTKLPTRVLRIDGPKQAALHTSTGEYAPYVCLSHCWGDKPLSILRTTTATLEQFQTEISWERLPKTFSDAIYVTHQLGLQYLGIDSLCIIQDSEEDWRHEGSMMADIYEFAHVMVAATKAPNADGGSFAHSHVSHVSREMTLNSEDARAEDAVYAIHSRAPLTHHSEANESHPLLSRGWVSDYRGRKLCNPC